MGKQHYKLTYFNVRGLGETIRYILSYGTKGDFEDERVSFDDWNSLKAKTPFGQLPILHINGKHELAQSKAIARYLAKEFGIAGHDHLEQAQADMFVDGLADTYPKGQELFAEMRKKLMDKTNYSEEIIKEKGDKWKNEAIIPFMETCEKTLVKNGTGHLVGSKLTWADIMIAEFIDRMMHVLNDPHMFDQFAKLKTLHKTVHALPGIAEYVEKRPFTPVWISNRIFVGLIILFRIHIYTV